MSRSKKLISEEEMIITRINWHLQQQLAWIASLLGSGIGLFQLLQIITYFPSISFFIYLGLLGWMTLSLGKIIEFFELQARENIKHYDLTQKHARKTRDILKWTWFQTFFLNVNYKYPKKREGRILFVQCLILGIGILLLLEKLEIVNLILIIKSVVFVR